MTVTLTAAQLEPSDKVWIVPETIHRYIFKLKCFLNNAALCACCRYKERQAEVRGLCSHKVINSLKEPFKNSQVACRSEEQATEQTQRLN